jgi:hypothetical protein
MFKLSSRVRNWPKGYGERQMARDRLPRWAKLAQITIWLSGWFLLMIAWTSLFLTLHQFIHPRSPYWPKQVLTTNLIVFPALFGTVVPGLILTNAVLWLILPLRRANERASNGVPGTSFKEATEDLISIAQYLTMASALVGLIGAWAPWE